MKIAVAGAGYVGLSIGALLAEHNNVVVTDIDERKVQMINRGESPIKDPLLASRLKRRILTATVNTENIYKFADIVIVAVPTNYDEDSNCFDTRAVETVIKSVLALNDNSLIVIKSTVPVGYTKAISKQLGTDRIIFSPEFLREGHALEDNIKPTRVIAGCDVQNHKQIEQATYFVRLMSKAASNDPPIMVMSSTEAEAVKLFANTYLAMRVCFFNELDTYSQEKGLNTRNIITGVCLDPRIGNGYNNPSFGYGGYCLPKDTKQLLANYTDVPENLIKAIVDSNQTRKEYVSDRIAEAVKDIDKDIVGIYRLTMKAHSDNFRQSAIQSIIQNLKDKGIRIQIYEPMMNDSEFMGCEIVHDIDKFKNDCCVIVANRIEPEISDVVNKIYSRDLFNRD